MATFWITDVWGDKLEFESPYKLLAIDGLGDVDPQYTTQAGPQQQGVSITNVRRGSRLISFAWTVISSTKLARWTDRTELADILANLEEDILFGITYDDASERQIEVRRAGGMSLPISAKLGPIQTKDVCSLIAQTPFWYNPVALVWAFAVGGGAGSFEFPLAFPISFGASTIDTQETKQYNGTAMELPIITVTGPATDLVLTNASIDKKLDFTGHAIAAAEVVTIDLRAGYKTVESTGATVIGDLTNDSDLLDWHLAPESEVVNGDNVIAVECSAATGATKIEFTAYERYVAI